MKRAPCLAIWPIIYMVQNIQTSPILHPHRFGMGVSFDSRRSFGSPSWSVCLLWGLVPGDATPVPWPASISRTCCKHTGLHSNREVCDWKCNIYNAIDCIAQGTAVNGLTSCTQCSPAAHVVRCRNESQSYTVNSIHTYMWAHMHIYCSGNRTRTCVNECTLLG